MEKKHSYWFAIALLCAASLISSCKKETTQNNQTTSKPPFTVATLNAPTDGIMYISPYNGADPNSGNLFILDKSGNVLTDQKLAAQAMNFRKWVINGVTRYSFLTNDPSAPVIPGPLTITGHMFVTDSSFNELEEISLLPYNGRSATAYNYLDTHDFILIDDNHYIAMSYYEKTVNNIPDSLHPLKNKKVTVPIIQEVENGSVVWEWDGSNFPEFYSTSVEENNFSDSTVANDYMHMNSMFIDPKDNNLMCSFRVCNQVVKLNRTTGAIIWRLGGKNSDFPMTSDQKFLRQHDVTIADDNNTILIFDNGEATERPSTRILELQLDEVNKKITSFKSFPIPTGDFTAFMGSVQKRGDTYFIGGGTANYVMEVNYKTSAVLFRMNLQIPTYRAYKF